jgi:CDP-diacylglycerol--serine O-phosphatidyltransferase
MASVGDTKYFKGLPIPVAASMIAFTILLYFQLIETDWIKDIVILVMIYILAFLMVSNIRYFTFKELNLAKRKPFSIFIFVVLSLVVIVMEPVIVLSAFILLYVFSGPVSMLWAWHKKKALSKMEPIPEEDYVIRG